MPFIILIIALILAFFVFRYVKKRRAQIALLRTPLSDDERAIVFDLVPLTQKLPPELCQSLEGKINRFRDQVEFIGCDGLELSEEIELSIAAQACLLVANKDAWFNTLRTILVYPSAFKSRIQSRDGYVMHENSQVRLGESWARGPVVLSWEHSHQGGANEEDGHNVVIHEFAHQLDDLSGATDGSPMLVKGQDPQAWDKAFNDAYFRLRERAQKRQNKLIDAYGATNAAEFFAVTVELFFEKAEQLKEKEPALYAQYVAYFKVDPSQWG